jgi:hypothetical protein
MIRITQKYNAIILLYVFYVAYILIKSMLFYKFHISPKDYLNNFESGNYFIIELLPIYLIGLLLLLTDDKIFYNYRFKYRTNIMIRQYKMVIVHSIIFVSLNFIICIVLFNYAYSFFRIHSTLYYVLLSIIHILGYVLVGGIVLLLNQLIRSNKINFIAFVYVMIIIEYFIVYESLLHRKMPLIISWVLAD